VQRFRSHTVIKTISPVWNERFEFMIPPGDGDYTLELRVIDGKWQADALGTLRIAVERGVGRGKGWYVLADAASGEIQVELTYGDASTTVSDRDRTPVAYKIHFDKLAGTILAVGKVGRVLAYTADKLGLRFSSLFGTCQQDAAASAAQEISRDPSGSGVGSSWHSFPIYEIAVAGIEDAFKGQVQSWNRNYHNAVSIFGPGPHTAMVRAGIVAEHHLLFTTLEKQAGLLYTGEQFLNLLNNGVFENKQRRYTYVVLPTRFLFAETSGSFAKVHFSLRVGVSLYA
jgi:hypothetical protein